MKSALVPCEACVRHVRADAPSCPFCGVQRAATRVVDIGPPPSHMKSLALMTFRAAALGAALGACGGETGPTSEQGGTTSTGGASNGGNPAGGAGAEPSIGGQNSGEGGNISVSAGGTANTRGGGAGVPIYRATPRG